MNNLELWEIWSAVPQEAQKKITGGRLKGMTDINPMWRIKTLTEVYGPVGFGWKYEILRQWCETGANGEVAAFCNINLQVKTKDGWSEPIPGTGGSSFVAKETSGYYTDNEAYKKALTDAISVACKALGMGASIYWQAGESKYQTKPSEEPEKNLPDLDYTQEVTPAEYKKAKEEMVTDDQVDLIMKEAETHPELAQYIADKFGGLPKMTKAQASKLISQLQKRESK